MHSEAPIERWQKTRPTWKKHEQSAGRKGAVESVSVFLYRKSLTEVVFRTDEQRSSDDIVPVWKKHEKNRGDKRHSWGSFDDLRTKHTQQVTDWKVHVSVHCKSLIIITQCSALMMSENPFGRFNDPAARNTRIATDLTCISEHHIDLKLRGYNAWLLWLRNSMILASFFSSLLNRSC